MDTKHDEISPNHRALVEGVLDGSINPDEAVAEINSLMESGEGFRTLDSKEELEFRQWARDNYEVGTEINTAWHPSVRDECEKMNRRK